MQLTSIKIAKPYNTRGFTVLEMALVMLVFGFLLTGLVTYYKVYIEQTRLEKSERIIQYTKRALDDYRLSVGKYPCPARAGLAPGAPGYGVADCTIVPVMGIMHGVLPDAIVPFLNKKDPIQNNLLDPWGQQLIYAVTADLSQATATTFNSKGGLITVVDEFNNNTGGINNDSHYVVVSMGGDTACLPGTYEEENCDNDNVFRDSIRYDSVAPAKYNDFIGYYNVADLSIWSDHAPGGVTIGDAKNDNTGNIGIDVANPTQKVEVAGDVATTSRSKINLICNNATGVCMMPEQFFNIRCPTSNEYIKAVNISSTGAVSVVCNTVSFNTFNTFVYASNPAVTVPGGNCANGIKYLVSDGTVACY